MNNFQELGSNDNHILAECYFVNLSSVDLFILVLYIIAIISIGWIAAKKVKTLDDFATGGRHYTTFFITATLASSFIGGGFTTGLAEKVYSLGLIYIIALWGFSLKEILVAKYIAPKMVNFPSAHSVGDIMGQLYGRRAKIFTGISAFLVCAGILGAQLMAFGHICNVLLGISSHFGAFICALIIMTYAGAGGMRAVVANDTLHFCVLMVSLPLVFYFGTQAIGGFEKLYFYSSMNFSNNISYSSIALIFLSFFFGETLVPPYVQRLLIGKTIKDTIKGNMASGLLSIPFFLMIGLIGIIAVTMNPDLNPNLALPYVVLESMPTGLKGLAIAGMMAIILSSADSFLNAASVSITHDVLTPIIPRLTQAQKLLISKYSTYVVALSGLLFTLSLESAIDILLEAYMFWTPIILVPFVAGVMSVQRPKKAFLYGAITGISVVTVIRLLSLKHSAYFEISIWGILANFIVFFAYRPMPNFSRNSV